MAKAKKTLEEMYKEIMKNPSFPDGYGMRKDDQDRFNSILHPDYSDYTTSTVTGNIC